MICPFCWHLKQHLSFLSHCCSSSLRGFPFLAKSVFAALISIGAKSSRRGLRALLARPCHLACLVLIKGLLLSLPKASLIIPKHWTSLQAASCQLSRFSGQVLHLIIAPWIPFLSPSLNFSRMPISLCGIPALCTKFSNLAI